MTLIAALCSLAGAPTAAPASVEPLFEYFATETKDDPKLKPFPPPGSGFEAPCGVGVDTSANVYVADYLHHAIDVFTPSRIFLTQLAKVDPLDGPCGLAVNAVGTLYVNSYHQGVLRYLPTKFPLGLGTSYGPPTVIDSTHATGIAVDPATNRLYVDHRTYISVYDSSGAQVLDGDGHPLHIGEGTLQDGYGLAFVQPPAPTAGRLYVADAATGTVKAYDPAVDIQTPVQEIDGSELPGGGFVSLRDSALAVDRNGGLLYVTDLLLPEGYERPEAAIYGFDVDGEYAGRLKYNVVDARPPGLAVDNSFGESAGRVYVTSGNTEGARLVAYAPGSLALVGSCAPEGPCPEDAGQQGLLFGTPGTSASPSTSAAGSAAERRSWATASSEIVQRGTLQVRTDGKIAPRKLPRRGTAPISVSVGGEITTTDESIPPQLKALRIEINRHGRLDYQGLPTCPYPSIQTASSQRALSACKSALVGGGSFQANIVLSGQQPYPTEGKLLVFNGEKAGKPVLYGHIYSARPFATSFVVVFSISKVKRGTYGTTLSADLPKTLGNWGYVTGIQMHLSRRYAYEGKRHSYLSSGCPAPDGFSRIAFPLARTSFDFVEAGRLTSTLTRECRARG